MLRGMLRTMRYARGWAAGADVVVEETEIVRDGVSVPSTLVLPARRPRPLPGWIVLGGMSRSGRFHPQLVRFGNALAASGAAVLVPGIPEWRRLEMAPGVTAPTIQGSVAALRKRKEVGPGKLGLVGFSFGAPQAAIAAAREETVEQIGGVVLFGGYCSLERTLTCQMTGQHEWQGAEYSLDPDPYGRWVVAKNHLTDVEGLEDAGDVAVALAHLAEAASGQRISAWEPYHDEMIRELRLTMPARWQALFDLFATPTNGTSAEREECREMAVRLSGACRRVEPLLDPEPDLIRVRLPTQLIHGRGDRLIPYTEGLRMRDGLPAEARAGLTVTELFSHSAGRVAGSWFDRAREGVTFFEALRRVINAV
jgi:pimeloyl-ACP methyl ester carboxylesterase